MLQPKKTNNGLTDQDNKILVQELTKYAGEGASDDDLRVFRDTFIKEKKKSTGQSSTSPGKNSDLETQDGSSATPKFKLAGGKTSIPKDVSDKVTKDIYGSSQENNNNNYNTDTSYVNQTTGKPMTTPVGEFAQVKREKEKELSKGFNEATLLTDNDEVEIQNRLKTEEANGGFFGGVKQGLIGFANMATKAMGRLADLPESDIKDIQIQNRTPFQDKIKEVKKEAFVNKEKLTETEIITRAKQRFVEEERNNIYVDKANSFLDNLSQEDKKILEIDRIDKATHLNENNQKLLRVQDALKTVFTDKQKDYTDILSQLEELKNNGQPIPSELIEKGISLENDLKKTADLVQKNYDGMVKNQEDLGTAEQELDLFKRENRDWANISKTIGIGFGKIGVGLLDAYNYFGKNVTNLVGTQGDPKALKEGFDTATKNTAELNQDLEDATDNLRKPVNSVESVEGFINYVSDTVANQVPILAMVSTGYGGLTALGASSTGQKYSKMNKEVAEGKATYTPMQMAVAPLFYGTSEAIFELSTLGILKRGARVISAIRNGGNDLIQKSIQQQALAFSKEFSKDMGREISQEEMTQFTQNFTDKYILGKDEVGLLDNTENVFKDTLTLTSILKVSPHIAGAMIKPFQIKNQLLRMDENAKKLIEFAAQLETEGITETERSIILGEIDKLTAESSKIMASTIEKVGEMPEELYNEILDLNKQAGELKAKAKEISINSKLRNKEELLSSLQEQYKNIQSKRQDIINGSVSVVEVLPIQEQDVIKRQAMEDLVTKLNPDGSKDITITDQQVINRANELYSESKINESEKTITQTGTPSSPEVATPSVQISENETAPTNDTAANGNVLTGTSVMGESNLPGQESLATENISEATDIATSKKPSKIKPENVVVDGNDLILQHGTPHNFDKFQLEKIGTGEGAQAFGYGLYFTDGSKIAGSYAKKLSEDKTGIVYTVRIKDGRTANWADWREPLNESQEEGLYNSLNENERKIYQQHLDKAFYPDSPNYDIRYEKDYHGVFDDLKTGKDGFSTYEKQSAVGLIYMDLKDAFGQEKATEIFKRSGLDGIRYRAKRGYGEETNYVVFNPQSISIESKSNDEKITHVQSGKNKSEVKTINVGDYNYAFEKGEWIASDKVGDIKPKGKKGNRYIPEKVYEKHAESFDFYQGQTAYDARMIEDVSTWEEDVAKHSENPIEVAETLLNLRAMDATEGLDYASKSIAEVIGEKSVERSSYIRFGDKNSISGSIALQYFSKKGKGQGIDQIAMQAEELAYGDYDASNPRITTDDVIDFIDSNPSGTQSFLNGPKREKIEALKSAFTELTGLPANDKYLNTAITKGKQREAFLKNAATVDVLTDEELLSLQNEIQQFQNEVYGTAEKTNQINPSREGIAETKSSEQNGGESAVQEESGNDGQRSEEGVEQISISENSTADQILNWLDDIENRLDNFGKENASSLIPIPIAIARVAIAAMRAAINAGKTVTEVIQAGIDALRQSQWYQSLTTQEQTGVEADFIKNLSNGDRQTENLLNRAIQSNITEDEAFDKFRDTAEKSRTELENKKPTKEYIRDQYRNFIQKFTDRQYIAKRLVGNSGLKNTKNLLINAHGSPGLSKIVFEDAYNKIYKKLTRKDRALLDEIIQAKRFIAIDNNRAERGLEPVSHPNFLDKNVSEKFLSKLEQEIGSEKYNDLNTRAEEYFKAYKKLLNDMFENGLISKDSFESLNDIDYQPRVFLQFVTDFNGDMETNNRKNNLDSGGLSSDQIKAMSEGDASSLVMNSEWLLMNSLLARMKAMANNNINKRFMTEEFPAAKKRFDALDPKNLQGDDKRFYKYFKELNSKVIDNPIIGTTESGNPKYKFDKTPINFAKMYYYVDGVQNQFFLEKELHESWNDNIGGFLSSGAKEFISYASGSALVKAIATGNNPAFPIVNTPRDFMFTVTFSDQYSKIVPKAMVQVGKDVIKAIREIRKKDSDIVNKYFEYGGAMDFLSTQGTLKKESVIGKMLDKTFSPNTKDTAKSIFSKLTLHKISLYSETMFRLGIFQRSIKNQLDELGLKDISEITDKQQIDDIYNQAVSSARGILDFNQGGNITKDLESVMPYINVAFQGGRVALTALEKDPVGTTSRILQVATLASAVPIGMSLFLIGVNKDDEDKEKSSYEIYLDALAGVSKYQKMKYMNIVTGKKDDEGQYQIIKIAKAQELSPVMSVTDNIYNNFIRKLAGKEKRSAALISEDALFTFNSNVMPVDISSPANFFTRTPIAKATLTYATGYDFFREEPLAMNLEKKPSPSEGMSMGSVEDFYKKLGVNYGLSPVRTKAFVESLITSPNTNPFVGVLYGGADAISSDKNMSEVGKKLTEDIYKSTGKRIIGYTSDFNRQLETSKVLEEKIEKIKLDDAIMKAEFKEVTQKYIDKELTKEELNSKLKELEPNDRKRMVNKLKDKLRMKDIDGTILDIKYEQNAEVKALMIMHHYGDIFDGSADSKEILKQMLRAKGILTPSVKYEYNKMKEQLKKKRPE